MGPDVSVLVSVYRQEYISPMQFSFKILLKGEWFNVLLWLLYSFYHFYEGYYFVCCCAVTGTVLAMPGGMQFLILHLIGIGWCKAVEGSRYMAYCFLCKNTITCANQVAVAQAIIETGQRKIAIGSKNLEDTKLKQIEVQKRKQALLDACLNMKRQKLV